MDQRTGVSQFLGRLLISSIFVIRGYAKLADHTSTVAMINSEGALLTYVSTVLSIVVELGGDPLYRRSLHTRRRGSARHFEEPRDGEGLRLIGHICAGAYGLDAVLSHRRVAIQH
jgi:hypothetical protein